MSSVQQVKEQRIVSTNTRTLDVPIAILVTTSKKPTHMATCAFFYKKVDSAATHSSLGTVSPFNNSKRGTRPLHARSLTRKYFQHFHTARYILVKALEEHAWRRSTSRYELQ